MLTHQELSTARLYAKMAEPTYFQKRSVVAFYVKLQTGVKVTIQDEEEKINQAFEVAKSFFVSEALELE